MKYLALILAGGTGVPLAVFAIASHLAYRHADQHGEAIRNAARDLPTCREAGCPASHPARPKELTR